MTKPPGIGMGVRVVDKITGFDGVITCHTESVTGCDRVGVESRHYSGVVASQMMWFDVDRLETFEAVRARNEEENVAIAKKREELWRADHEDVRNEAIGWAYADCIATWDAGNDPRKSDMPSVIARAAKDLAGDTKETP